VLYVALLQSAIAAFAVADAVVAVAVALGVLEHVACNWF